MHARTWLVLAVLGAGCARPASLAHLAPAAAPELFAPGVISTEAPEFATTFTPDGRTAFFNRASADRSRLVIWMAQWQDGAWTAPAVAPFSGGDWADVDPFVTADGRRLYFSSTRPRAGRSGGDFNTWYVERRAEGWSAPVDPGPPLNSDSGDIYVTQSAAGELVFSSGRAGAGRIWMTREEGGRWREPWPLQFGSLQGGGNPLIARDGRWLVLVQTRPGRGAELFVSCRRGDAWEEPVALSAAVNSRWTDFAPALDPSGRVLYFTSERPGLVGAQPDSVRPPGDLYRVGVREAGIEC